MTVKDTPLPIPFKSDTATHTRLRGGRLWIARTVCLAIIALGVGMYAASLPLAYNNLRMPCQTPTCPTVEQLRPDEIARLQGFGLSLEFYAAYIMVILALFPTIFVGMSLLIFWLRSNDWMAIFGSLALATFGLTAAPATEALVAASPFWKWPLVFLQTVGIGSFASYFFLFPNGRFVPRWTIWLAVAYPLIIAAFAAQGSMFTNPVIFAIFLISIGTSAAAQVYRYRRVSTPLERQQTKWIVLGLTLMFALITLGFLPVFFVPTIREFGLEGKLYNAVRVIFFAVIPLTIFIVSFAFSVLRYRLWDVDFVINRSLVYSGLTLLLGGFFVGAFFGLRAVLGSILGSGQDWIAAGVSGAVIVGLFNPARRWLRRFVDQRLYGIQIEYTPGKAAAPSVTAPRSTLGTYEGLELIGRGGMAEVYKANHPTLRRPVAIKVLPHSLAQDSDFRHRFEREAQTVAALKHPNIVQLFDFGEADGTSFMVIEYIGGPDVGDLLKQGAMPTERALAITRAVAGALDYAHQQGLVHRDIKPSNVMLDPITATGMDSRGERAVLMDFGIARILGGNTRLTASGMIGTLDYMSPEQIKDSKDVDGRADIYSLGVMLFQMLTGRLPFTASNPGAMLIAHLNQPAPDPRTVRDDIPESASVAALRAMEKDPAYRFQTAGEFAAALS